MKHKTLLVSMIVALCVALAGAVSAQAGVAAQTALGTSFNYQGRLNRSGTPYTGVCSFQFSLWDAVSAGTQKGSTLTLNSVTVTNGLFNVDLDFGNQFNGEARWVETSVQCSGDGSFTTLSPRQAIKATPYAVYAQDTGTLQTYPVSTTAPLSGQVLKWNGSAWAPGADNTSSGGSYSNGFGLNLIGNVFSVLTSTIQSRVNGSCSSGNAIRVIRADGSVTCEPIGSGWSLTGNSGTNSASNFIGTTDNESLTFRVNNAVAYQLVPAFDTNNNSPAPIIIGGYSGNTAASTAFGAMIGGGGVNGATNNIGANGAYATIGGGGGNYIDGSVSTIGGGAANGITSTWATIGGGYGNFARGDFATIAGGAFNTVTGTGAFIGGGGTDGSTDDGSQRNQAVAPASVIGGGISNTVGAYGSYATIGGGRNNTNNALEATVSGGANNTASLDHATIAGGSNNTANGFYATVSGGYNNVASGNGSVIPGGFSNVASGTASFAGGYNAHASHDGSFVWMDENVGSHGTYGSSANNQFRVFATGGVQFITGMNFSNGTVTSGSYLNAGSGTWSSFSDRNVKANFENVDPRTVLSELNSIPIQKWNYIAQDPSIRHIGPMAQDFYAAFGVGEDQRYIGVVDADGVALAAIQGLSQVVQDKDAKIDAQQKQIDSLEARLTALEQAAPANNVGAHSEGASSLALLALGGLVGIVVMQTVRRRGE